MKRMKTVEKQIGDSIFYIKPFPAFTAASISGDLVALIGSNKGTEEGEVPQPENEGAEEFNIMDTDLDKALPAFSSALSSLSGEKIESFMKKLLIENKNVSVESEITDGEVKILTMDLANEIFCMDLQDMFVLCFEVVKINYGNFFKKLGGRFGNLTESIQKMAPGMISGDTSM